MKVCTSSSVSLGGKEGTLEWSSKVSRRALAKPSGRAKTPGKTAPGHSGWEEVGGVSNGRN